jgi:hypothetical protein
VTEGASSGDCAPDPTRIPTRQEFAEALTMLRERVGLTIGTLPS